MRQHDLLEMFTQQCALRKTATAIEWGDEQISYLALRQQTASIAHHLQQKKPGNIALYLDSCPTLVSTLLACLHTGHVFAPVNVGLPGAAGRQNDTTHRAVVYCDFSASCREAREDCSLAA